MPQVPPQNLKGHHYRACSVDGNAWPQSSPHWARKGHKITHQARRHEKHNNFPRCHLFLQPRSPSLITFCRSQRGNKNASLLPKPAPCNVLREESGSQMSFLAPAPNSFPYPHPAASLLFSIFPSLHSLFAAIQCCSLGQSLVSGMRDARCAARLASEPLQEIALIPWCCCARKR